MIFDRIAERALPLVNDVALYPAQSLRKRLLQAASGTVLEAGYGSGVNAQYYSEAVDRVIALEPSDPMWNRGEVRARRAGLEAQRINGFVESIPLDDCTVDFAVSTFVLCSVRDVDQALNELFRVLKTGAGLLLVEHTENPRPKVAKLQQMVTPLWSKCLAGCHPGRPIERALEDSPFECVWSETTQFGWLPRVIEQHVFGHWRKPSNF